MTQENTITVCDEEYLMAWDLYKETGIRQAMPLSLLHLKDLIANGKFDDALAHLERMMTIWCDEKDAVKLKCSLHKRCGQTASALTTAYYGLSRSHRTPDAEYYVKNIIQLTGKGDMLEYDRCTLRAAAKIPVEPLVWPLSMAGDYIDAKAEFDCYMSSCPNQRLTICLTGDGVVHVNVPKRASMAEEKVMVRFLVNVTRIAEPDSDTVAVNAKITRNPEVTVTSVTSDASPDSAPIPMIKCGDSVHTLKTNSFRNFILVSGQEALGEPQQVSFDLVLSVGQVDLVLKSPVMRIAVV